MSTHVEQTKILSYDTAIYVRRSSSGTYEIPGVAERENWCDVATDLHDIEDSGPLLGWGRWERVASGLDEDGVRHWYFLRNEE